MNSQAIRFAAESKPVRQAFQMFQLSQYGDITGECQALLHMFSFWNARYSEQPPYKFTLRGDHELLKASPNLQCSWGFLHQGAWKNCCKGYNMMCPWEVSSFPANQIQEIPGQTQSFAGVPAPELLSKWWHNAVWRLYFYMQGKIGRTWIITLSNNTYWEKQK